MTDLSRKELGLLSCPPQPPQQLSDARTDRESFPDRSPSGRRVGYELAGSVRGRERGTRGDRFAWSEFSVWEVRENLGLDFTTLLALVRNSELRLRWIRFHLHEVRVPLAALLFGPPVPSLCPVVWSCEGCARVALTRSEAATSLPTAPTNCCLPLLSSHVYLRVS